MRHIQTVQLMKLSFLLWQMRRRCYKRQHISHIGRTTFHFCRSFRSCIASAPAQKQQTSTIFLTQAYSSRRIQHAPGSGASSSQTPRAVKSQPLREKFDSPRAGMLKCVQIYACTWYTHAYIFKKKNSRFWGKVTRSGDRKQGIFLVRPYIICAIETPCNATCFYHLPPCIFSIAYAIEKI